VLSASFHFFPWETWVKPGKLKHQWHISTKGMEWKRMWIKSAEGAGSAQKDEDNQSTDKVSFHPSPINTFSDGVTMPLYRISERLLLVIEMAYAITFLKKKLWPIACSSKGIE